MPVCSSPVGQFFLMDQWIIGFSGRWCFVVFEELLYIAEFAFVRLEAETIEDRESKATVMEPTFEV